MGKEKTILDIILDTCNLKDNHIKFKIHYYFYVSFGTRIVQSHYNVPYYNAVFNITQPYHGSETDYFSILYISFSNLIITLYTVSLIHGLILWTPKIAL